MPRVGAAAVLPPSRDPPEPSVRLGIRLFTIGVGVFTLIVEMQLLTTLGVVGKPAVSVAEARAQAKADGRPAPAFELPTLDSRGTMGLGDFSNKVVVLNFWESSCGSCRLEAADLEGAWKVYQSRQVQFLGVDVGDERTEALAFQEEAGLTFPSVLDASGSLAAEYGLVGVPSTLIVDGQGRIAYRFVGRVESPMLRSALDDVLGPGA